MRMRVMAAAMLGSAAVGAVLAGCAPAAGDPVERFALEWLATDEGEGAVYCGGERSAIPLQSDRPELVRTEITGNGEFVEIDFDAVSPTDGAPVRGMLTVRLDEAGAPECVTWATMQR